MNCAQCRKELGVGSDVLSVQQGVVGTRGIVPLDEPVVLCSENCTRSYHDDGGAATLKRRRP
jgi:hypothetical protein